MICMRDVYDIYINKSRHDNIIPLCDMKCESILSNNSLYN